MFYTSKNCFNFYVLKCLKINIRGNFLSNFTFYFFFFLVCYTRLNHSAQELSCLHNLRFFIFLSTGEKKIWNQTCKIRNIFLNTSMQSLQQVFPQIKLHSILDIWGHVRTNKILWDILPPNGALVLSRGCGCKNKSSNSPFYRYVLCLCLTGD